MSGKSEQNSIDTGGDDSVQQQQQQQQHSVSSSSTSTSCSTAADKAAADIIIAPFADKKADVVTCDDSSFLSTVMPEQEKTKKESAEAAFINIFLANDDNKCNGNNNNELSPPPMNNNDGPSSSSSPFLGCSSDASSVNCTAATTRECCPVLVVESTAISDQQSAILSLQQQQQQNNCNSEGNSKTNAAAAAASFLSSSDAVMGEGKNVAEQVPENKINPSTDTENVISKENQAENSQSTVPDNTTSVVDDDDKNPRLSTAAAVPSKSAKEEKETATAATTPCTTSAISSSGDNIGGSSSSSCCSLLAALPMDSLHHVASFLTPSEWSNFGKTCSSAHRVYAEIIRRVRLHGFKCATEVVTAWKLHQQHGDAKELVALYIKSGVPIYPSSLGHSYHSLVWRMQVETKEIIKLQQQQVGRNSNNNSNNNNAQGTATAIPESNELAAAAANNDGQSSQPSSAVAESSSSTNNATNSNTATTTAEGGPPHVDPFFTDRLDFRAAQGYSPRRVTYLEEKCLYWMDHDATAAAAAAAAQLSDASAATSAGSHGNSSSSSSSATTPTRRGNFRTTHLTVIPPAAIAEYRAMIMGENAEATTTTTNLRRNNHHHATNNATARTQPSPSRQSSVSSQPSSSPIRGRGGLLSSCYHGHARMPLKIHQHLLNQHRIGMYCVDDQDGTMVTPPISLSADFYHPQQQRPSYATEKMDEAQDDNVDNAAGDPTVSIIPEVARPTDQQQQPGVGGVLVRDNVQNNVDHAALPDDDNGDDQHPEDVTDEASAEPQPPPSPFRLSAIANYCDLEAYTAGSLNGTENNNKKTTDTTTHNNNNGSRELKRHLRSRFATYQRRLNTFLSHSDSCGFEECMLDFWDEFFPHTANIQYYDLHTPVPRISCLPKFLTKPCPKSIGIVQCEIERIKITTKGKGVSMKGRLFPTYEYRLFIRNQPHRDAQQEGVEDDVDEPFTRRDTVLMVAKNRGRKHAEVSGVTPTKKGANNYYLYMPQQADVDAHFNKVNGIVDEPSKKMNSNGASHEPVLISDETSSVLMGRLQSNFIGTEFQIFTPSVRKQRRKHDVQLPRTVMSPSDDEVDYDSGVSSDNNSSRRSRFGRFLRSNPAASCSDASSGSLETPRTRARSEPRRASSPDLGYRPNRPNRRAIANSEHQQQVTTQTTTTMAEEEDGAITYTANLLGSRPRIMDVCIPKVATDGVAGKEWKKFLESCEDHDDCRMLNCFKTIQQRLENLDPQLPRLPGDLMAAHPRLDDRRDGDNSNNTATTTAGGDDHHGLLALQNRPPWWNVELGSFVLNFGGRVSVASVKNFQLCDRNDQDNIMLQFGRIQGRHSFTMDFQHPLTAVQAFSIAISSLQSKISFG